MVNAHSIAVAIRTSYDSHYVDVFDYTFGGQFYFSKPFQLGKNMWGREDNNLPGQDVNGPKHIHVYGKDGKGWEQHSNGEPSHVGHKDILPGGPPEWVKEELKKQKGWDWDAKDKEKQARDANNTNKSWTDLDMWSNDPFYPTPTMPSTPVGPPPFPVMPFAF